MVNITHHTPGLCTNTDPKIVGCFTAKLRQPDAPIEYPMQPRALALSTVLYVLST